MKTELADPGRRPKAPAIDDETRAKASQNVGWLAPEHADEIREILGLSAPEKPGGGWRNHVCPTCGAVPNTPCQSSERAMMRRAHLGRMRLAKGDQQ